LFVKLFYLAFSFSTTSTCTKN